MPSRTPGPDAVRVYLETGKRRVFAGALDWPGWCRSGRSAEAAIQTLADYAERYAEVVRRAGLAFPLDGLELVEVERLPGTTTTEFGAPDVVAQADTAPLDAAGARRVVALLSAAWALLEDVVAGAPAELRKGPRGGGRDRDAVDAHVRAAEVSYARKLGVRYPQATADDPAAMAQLRDDLRATLGVPSDGALLTPNGWPPRYAARRIAWHVLDHAWEIQDKSTS